MSDLQVFVLSIAILFTSSCVSYFGLKALQPSISNRLLFWLASTLPPLILLSSIEVYEFFNPRSEELAHGNLFGYWTYIAILVIFWIPSAVTVLLLRMRFRKK